MNLSTITKSTAIYTKQDDTITGSGARDPMGFEALWSYLGQEVFNNKITSIANDVRNYTIALLHHAVVRQLKMEGLFQRILELLRKQGGGQKAPREQEVVVAIIIFLENLLIYAMVKVGGDGREVKTDGLLGTSKGASAPFNEIRISRYKDAFVLVNQANIGLNARYKTPFIKMELYDQYYNYDFKRNDHPQIWDQVDQFHSDFNTLRDKIVQIIRYMASAKILTLELKENQYPSVLSEVINGYRTIFATPSMQPYYTIIEFWKEQLGFKRPSAGYIYMAMVDTIAEPGNLENGIPYRKVLAKAYDKANAENDSKNAYKFSAIVNTESFLTPLRYLFDLLLTGRYKNVDDADVMKKGGEVMRIAKENADPNIQAYFSPASQYVQERVNRLLSQVVHVDNPIDFIRDLLFYHTTIVNERRNIPWIRVEEGKIKVLSGTIVKQDPDAPIYPWYHSYYLDSLYNIITGFGETEEDSG